MLMLAPWVAILCGCPGILSSHRAGEAGTWDLGAAGLDGSAPSVVGQDGGGHDAGLRDAIAAPEAGQASPPTPPPPTGTRDPYQQPFAASSIWNLPIGDAATYVPGQIPTATAYGMTVDHDVLILTPGAPLTNVHYNSDGWSGTRCGTDGQVLFTAPIPASFVVPGNNDAHGGTPNHSAAVLMTDGRTLRQNQPFTRCQAGGGATTWVEYPTVDLYGEGAEGAHGGSGLSSIGGTLRLGELKPGNKIRHALKVNLYAKESISGQSPGYRWPAVKADSYWQGTYGGSVPQLKMGALLALPPSVNVDEPGWLQTQPARILAWTLQNYGAYVVDDTGWSVYAIATEYSPDGDVTQEFQSTWGFSMTPSSKSDPWAQDMDKIFGKLQVVDSWDAAAHQKVAASNGALGAGGGAPRQPWAPAITPP